MTSTNCEDQITAMPIGLTWDPSRFLMTDWFSVIHLMENAPSGRPVFWKCSTSIQEFHNSGHMWEPVSIELENRIISADPGSNAAKFHLGAKIAPALQGPIICLLAIGTSMRRRGCLQRGVPRWIQVYTVSIYIYICNYVHIYIYIYIWIHTHTHA